MNFNSPICFCAHRCISEKVHGINLLQMWKDVQGATQGCSNGHMVHCRIRKVHTFPC